MSTSNGEPANKTVFNTSYVSREVDDNKIGKLDLENVVADSGASILNVQKELNGQASFAGDTTNGAKNRKPTWVSDVIGVANDDTKTRVDAVQAQTETNTSGIAANTAENVASRATSGTSTGDTDMGVYTGAIISDNVSQATANQELETGIEARILLTEKGAANGVATLDAGSRLPASQLPTSATEYKGAWNASTNTPTLIDGTGTNGDLYRVSVAGSQDLGSGSISYGVGDALIYNGAIWQRIPADDAVTSVNGFTGIVVLDADDIAEGAVNFYYTDPKVDARIALAVIDDLADVDTTTSVPVNGDALVFDGTDWVPGAGGSGSGAGKKNYFDDGNFENNIDLATVYDDTGAYVDGTGAGATVISIVQNAATPLAGTKDLKISKIALDAIGEGVTLLTQTIDNADLGRDLSFEMELDFSAANYTSGNVVFKAYDVTNSVILPVVPVANLDDDAGILNAQVKAYGKVLVGSTTAVVRLSLHTVIDSQTGLAWDGFIDDCVIGPDNILTSPAMNTIETKILSADVTTDVTATDLSFTGLVIDKWYEVRGQMALRVNEGAKDTLCFVNAVHDSATIARPLFQISTAGDIEDDQVNLAVSFSFQATATTLTFLVQSATVDSYLAGDNSKAETFIELETRNDMSVTNILSASEASYTTLTFDGASNDSRIITADTEDIYFITTDDQFNAWNGTAFIAPKDMRIIINGSVRWTTATNFAISAYIDGVVTKNLSGNSGGGSPSVTTLKTFGGTINLLKGEALSVRTDVTLTCNPVAAHHWISITVQPDYNIFGVYGETDYKEVLLSANSVTVTANVPADITGAVLSLAEGEWQVGFGIPMFMDWIGGASTALNGGFFLTDAANGIIPGSEAANYAIMSNADDERTMFTSHTVNVLVTQAQIYKLRLRASQTDTVARIFADATSSYGDAIFWARRIR